MTSCKGCGRKIVWGLTEDGKKIPLDPSAPVYAITGREEVNGMKQVIRLKADEAAVTHFSTCRKADQFSASRRT